MLKKSLAATLWAWLALAALPALADAIALDLAAPGRPATDATRDALDHPAQLLEFAGLKPGMKVADIFGGSGYYAELIAQAVRPGGTAILHNNAAYIGFVGKPLEQRLAGGRLANLSRLDAEADALGLAPDSLDGVFLVLAFHDFYFREKDWAVTASQVMPQLRAALKPGGFLLVVDHAARAGTGSAAAQQLHRIDEAFARETIAGFGFEFRADSPLLRNAADDRTLSAFDLKVRGRTDRFVHLYRSPD